MLKYFVQVQIKFQLFIINHVRFLVAVYWEDTQRWEEKTIIWPSGMFDRQKQVLLSKIVLKS